jgi:hypothetical protein
LRKYRNGSSSQGREQKTECFGHVDLLEHAVTSFRGECRKSS